MTYAGCKSGAAGRVAMPSIDGRKKAIYIKGLPTANGLVAARQSIA